ncbi:MAG: MaoC family dehydratase [Chloroflexi bacterium]|nr:MaoC family dehydratase [Chloroflexota bacterium]
MTVEALPIIPATYKLPEGTDADAFFDLEPGPLGSYQMTIAEADVERWARIHEDKAPWRAEPGAEPAAPPYIGYYACMNALEPIRYFGNTGRPSYGPGGLSRYWAEFHAPLPLGAALQVTGRVADKYTRRGIGYTDWEVDITHEGRLLQRNGRAWATSIPPEEQEKWPEREGRPRPPDAPADAEVFGPLAYVTSQEHVDDLEGPGEHNTHTDVAAAKAQGLRGPRAQGELSFALLSRLMTQRFGASFANGGSLDIRLIGEVQAGDTQTGYGAVVESRADGSELCRVWVENQDGQLVTVGTATHVAASS